MSEIFNVGLDLICGFAAGCAQIVTGQPLDFIKTKFQTLQNTQQGFKDIAKSIFTDYGMLGFYRGASSLFCGHAVIIAMEFGIYEKAKKMQMQNHQPTYLSPEEILSIKEIGIAGGAVGFFVSFVYCPVEYTKITRQLNPDLQIGSFRLLMK